MSGPEIGQPAPRFTTRNQHGESVSLSDLRGAPVVLVFYPFAFTDICTGELAAVQAHLAELRTLGAQVLAVSTDTMFTLRVFAEQQGLEFSLLSDHWPHGAIATSYGAFDAQLGCALRASYVVDSDGIVTWKVVNQIGEARDIAEHVRAVAA